jgi:hypothetical protein
MSRCACRGWKKPGPGATGGLPGRLFRRETGFSPKKFREFTNAYAIRRSQNREIHGKFNIRDYLNYMVE